MTDNSQPLVSVVTPVYNGEKYLAECAESILAQTYDNWEYVIVNNCSKDRTLDIAKRYADKDSRIRVVDNAEFLPLIANWNHAMRQVSTESKYCKVVHADDWIFPECIEKMVELAERYPSVGIVGAYALQGDRVFLDGIPYSKKVVPGREICRTTLLGEYYVFGTPTSLLVRSDIIRNRRAFYNESIIYADIIACYDVLQDTDFGFVHQVLTCTRLHDASVTSSIWRFDRPWNQSRLIGVVMYGPKYLTKEEFETRLTLVMRRYYRFLVKNALRWPEKAFWQFHKEGFESVGYPLSYSKLIKAICVEVVDAVGNPKETLSKILKRLRNSWIR